MKRPAKENEIVANVITTNNGQLISRILDKEVLVETILELIEKYSRITIYKSKHMSIIDTISIKRLQEE